MRVDVLHRRLVSFKDLCRLMLSISSGNRRRCTVFIASLLADFNNIILTLHSDFLVLELVKV